MQNLKQGQQVEKLGSASDYTVGRKGVVIDYDNSTRNGDTYRIHWQCDKHGEVINVRTWNAEKKLLKIGEDLNKVAPKLAAVVSQPELFQDSDLQKFANIALAAFNGAGSVHITFTQGDKINFLRLTGDVMQKVCQAICEDAQRKKYYTEAVNELRKAGDALGGQPL
jgi:hypothetical protein